MWRRRVLERAVDVTASSAERSCLVLAPHPDDETIGCGATIARKRAAGTPVRVVVATDGRHSHRSRVLGPDQLAAVRATEVADACAELGVEPDQLILLGHHEGTLSDDTGLLVDQIHEQISEFAPDEVLVTSGRDWHLDHQELNSAAHLAVARLDESARPTVREFPVWLWADGPWRGPSRPRRATAALSPLAEARTLRVERVATAGFVEAKRRALACHRSQTSNITGEAEWPVLDQAFVESFLGASEVFLEPAELDRRPDRAPSAVPSPDRSTTRSRT